MSSTYTIHLIEKSNIASHSCITTDTIATTLPPLQDGSILARTTLVSLSANNLSYAHMGSFLHWWDAFPAPSGDQSKYGIVPVWGYAEVLESKITSITRGQLIWGFWPSHNMPVALKLRKDDGVPGHWIEISEYRGKMMNLYNRYQQSPNDLEIAGLGRNEVLEKIAWQTVVAPVGGAGWALNRFVFGERAIHPGGGEEWRAEDADLSKAVVISLAASGKTARFFNHELVHSRKPGSGPLGLVAVTASSDGSLIPKAPFPTRTISYSAITDPETLQWIAELNPHKVVLVDFGSRGSCLEDLTNAVETNLSSIKLVNIGVGREAKAFTPEELTVHGKKLAEIPSRIQMNASGLYDTAMDTVGRKTFFQERERACDQFITNGGLNGMELQWGEGIAGDNGIEGGWRRLCESTVAPGAAMVFRI